MFPLDRDSSQKFPTRVILFYSNDVPSYNLLLLKGKIVFPYVYQGLTSIHKTYTCILISPLFVYQRVHQILMFTQPPPRPYLSTGFPQVIHRLPGKY